MFNLDESPQNIEGFKQLASSIGGQHSLLIHPRTRKLKDLFAPVVAAGLAAVPLCELEDKLVVAISENAHPDAPRALAFALGRDIVDIKFSSELLIEFVEHTYLHAGGKFRAIDLPTFTDADFLKTDDALKLLFEKDSTMPVGELDIPKGKIAFIELSLYSHSSSPDNFSQVHFTPPQAVLPFRITTDELGVKCADVFETEDSFGTSRVRIMFERFYDGQDHTRTLEGHELQELPKVLHPSEIQIVSLSEDAIGIWCYDHIEEFARTEIEDKTKTCIETEYWYINYGMRFKRKLRLELRAFDIVDKEKINFVGDQSQLGPKDLTKIFGNMSY